MKNFMGWLLDGATVRDLGGIAAIGSISYGAWAIYRPAGFLAGGLIVLALVLYSALKTKGPSA